MTDKVKRALHFASDAHKGQKRKYTGEDYIVHPIEVASLIAHIGNEDMECAALLHDVVEDTPVTLYKIYCEFGGIVSTLVDQLTERKIEGNRKIRKASELKRIATISPEAKTIKLADLISNSKSIVTHDPNFAKVYMKEKYELLQVLHEGDQVLYQRAYKIIKDYQNGTRTTD